MTRLVYFIIVTLILERIDKPISNFVWRDDFAGGLQEGLGVLRSGSKGGDVLLQGKLQTTNNTKMQENYKQPKNARKLQKAYK